MFTRFSSFHLTIYETVSKLLALTLKTDKQSNRSLNNWNLQKTDKLVSQVAACDGTQNYDFGGRTSSSTGYHTNILK